MWAIIAVYWIHPTHKLIIAEKVEDSCEPQGLDAWRGVWYSVITLTQTVVFGDSWGTTAIEIIKREPITLLFCRDVRYHHPWGAEPDRRCHR